MSPMLEIQHPLKVGISAGMHSGFFFCFQNSYQSREKKGFNTCLILLNFLKISNELVSLSPSHKDPKYISLL